MPHVQQEPKVVRFHAGGKPGTRPVLEGPDAKVTFNEIPIIDVSPMFSDSLDERKKVAAQVGKACQDVGFFYAKNHSIPEDIVKSTFEAIAKFFAQNEEIKLETHIHKCAFMRGYEPLFETKLDPNSRGDLKEAFTMGDDGTDEEQQAPKSSGPYPKKNIWPENNPQFRKALYEYYHQVLSFSHKLLRIFALALEMPEDYFDNTSSFPLTGMRPIHYPSQPKGGTDIGIGAHTDYSLFTLVNQDHNSGLEVLNGNGIWIAAPPVERSFVVNIGDFLMQATNNKWQSTVHRVVNTGQDRYSIPFFFSPNEDAQVTVLPSCRVEGQGYEDINVGEYYARRLQLARPKHPGVVTNAAQAITA